MPRNTFSGHIVSGSGRGKGMGTPTLNIDLADVPSDLKEGIYACKVLIDGYTYDAAMHYGPRPVHKDKPSCEVHLLNAEPEPRTRTLTIEVIAYLREVRDFPTEAALIAQIADDIQKARGILQGYDRAIETADS